jgi:hypothetical protein
VGRGDAVALLPGHGQPEPGSGARPGQVPSGPQIVPPFFTPLFYSVFREGWLECGDSKVQWSVHDGGCPRGRCDAACVRAVWRGGHGGGGAAHTRAPCARGGPGSPPTGAHTPHNRFYFVVF